MVVALLTLGLCTQCSLLPGSVPPSEPPTQAIYPTAEHLPDSCVR